MGQPPRRIPFREVISVQIHVVLPGETLSSIGRQYGLPPGLIARYNGLEDANRLAVGQSLLILFPAQTYTVQPGDTLFSAANLLGVTALQLLRDNPNLGGLPALYPGQVLVAGFDDVRTRSVEVTGYAYPFADTSVLRGILPYASALIPFTYGIAADGGVVPLEDETLIALAQQYGVRPLMHLSTLTEDGSFSSARASAVLRSAEARRQLADAVISAMLAKGYEGLDVDFEYVDPEDAALYASFLGQLRQRVNALGYGLTAALAPKTYAEQPGALYQGHNYALIGQNADVLLLMTYEWGYTYGPPMAVAPLASVQRVLDYAVSEFPAQKVLLGIPNYAYDWTLPFVAGSSRARLIGNQDAVALAVRQGAEIQFDSTAATPWFTYTDGSGSVHEVWFEDVRSIQAKLDLIEEYGLRGAGYWNFMRPFVANFSLLNARFQID